MKMLQPAEAQVRPPRLLFLAYLHMQNSIVRRQGINESLQLLRQGSHQIHHQHRPIPSTSCAESVSQQHEPQTPISHASHE